MSTQLPWPAIGALLSGLISLYFVRYLWQYRANKGGWFFIATIAAEALWAFAYGGGLLVFDPAIRWFFEIPIWLGINFIGVFFLAFALEYTGRGEIVRSKWLGLLVLLQLGHTVLVVTNPLHQIAWSNYSIEPIFGVATVTYIHQPWLFVNLAGITVMVAAAGFILLDTFVSYGPLYRGQTAALALSPILPGVALLFWVFELGPFYPLNLAVFTFPIHLGFDMYAFFRRNMFELTPAARRVGNQAAIEDLASAVVIADPNHRIINLNKRARALFAATGDNILGRELSDFVDIDPTVDQQTISLTTDGERRDYAVSLSTIEDSTGTVVGSSLVFQDITTEKQREQRLTVMNRVLRHNLRNDLNVVQGTLQVAEDAVTDESIREMVTTAKTKAAEVMALGEQARRIERVIETESPPNDAVNLLDSLRDVESTLLERYDARIEIDVPPEVSVRADKALLDQVFENLMENAIVHNPEESPTVNVVTHPINRSAPILTVEVRDNGPGIPEHERAVIETGEETALQHGSGLGLWLVKWGVESIGGELEFEVTTDGTTVRLTLPRDTHSHNDAQTTPTE